MSIKVNLSSLSATEKKEHFKKLCCFESNTKNNIISLQKPLNEDIYSFPFCYSLNIFQNDDILSLWKNKRFDKLNYIFTGNIWKKNKRLARDGIINLRSKNSTIYSFRPGTGKTIISIYTACKIKYKTIIILRSNLMEQWHKSLSDITNAEIYIIPTRKKISKDYLIYMTIYLVK